MSDHVQIVYVTLYTISFCEWYWALCQNICFLGKVQFYECICIKIVYVIAKKTNIILISKRAFSKPKSHLNKKYSLFNLFLVVNGCAFYHFIQIFFLQFVLVFSFICLHGIYKNDICMEAIMYICTFMFSVTQVIIAIVITFVTVNFLIYMYVIII